MGKLAAAHHLVKQAVDKTKLIIVHVEKLLNGAGGIMSDDKVHPVAVGRQLIEGVLGFLNGWLLFFPKSFSTCLLYTSSAGLLRHCGFGQM